MTTRGRLGVTCKWLAPDGRPHPTWVFRGINRKIYREHGPRRLREVALHNAAMLGTVVEALATAPQRRRMFRIGNDILPLLTLPEARRAWRDTGFVRDMEHLWGRAGRIAREGDVRLSTHPSQFVVPNSVRAEIRRKSITELDRWAHWADVLGTPAFCINIHLAPLFDERRETVVASWHRVRQEASERAWRLLTVENDDKMWTIGDLLAAARATEFRPVVDVHHHWVVTGVWPDPVRLGRAVVPLWHGQRPKVHVSIPKGRYYTRAGLDAAGLPLRMAGTNRLDEAGEVADRFNPRAHALLPWAPGLAAYVRELLGWADCVIELKGKNLAVRQLCDQIDALPPK